ncbi:MAG TPA: CBS domain-containing protein [Candidatus Saccharimonadales bacterium]|nr:CBS domain-containing protein [Candidatus Saccharimonadales bacterium]
MIASISGLVLIMLGLLALVLQRFYSSVPAKELKRLAVRQDPLAEALYRPVAYGASMRLLLWTVFCLGLAGGFFLVISSFMPVAAFVVVSLSVAAVVLLQSLRLTVRSAHFAVKAAPALNWLLNYMHRPFDALARSINRFRTQTTHSGLYEKEDVLNLLAQQRAQPDNRIAPQDLDLMMHAVQFDDRKAADIVLPMSRSRSVSMHDHIGPILLGELHESGQTNFLVYDGQPDKVVGTLFLRDAMSAREGGRVEDVMHAKVCYVHEDFGLRQVLHAFIQTGQFMVVVINAFEEPVGVISLQHLLAQLVGEQLDDEFDAYENRAAVAAWRPALEPVPVQGSTDEGEPVEQPATESID